MYTYACYNVLRSIASIMEGAIIADRLCEGDGGGGIVIFWEIVGDLDGRLVVVELADIDGDSKRYPS
jgi:hypothetical protein